MGRLVGPDAEKLKDSKLVMWFIGVVRVLDVEMELVWRMRAALFNVETRASPGNESRTYMPATQPVGVKLSGDRVRVW